MSDFDAAEFMSSAPRSVGGNSSWAEAYGAEHKRIIKRYAARSPRTLQKHLGPSELGHECDRLMVAKMARVPVTNHVSDPWASIVGTAIHAYLADAYDWDNIDEGRLRWVTEQRVTPDPGDDPHPGTADLYDAQWRALCDHKGVATDTRVPTPSGWTTMGELKTGDEVFGSDGRICRVTKTYPVQYRDCYRVEFKGGLSVVTDDVQQWEVRRNRNGGYSTKSPETVLLSSAEMAAQLYAASGQRHLRVATCGALDLPEVELPVHPYVLGCWLGDGYHGGSQISKPDAELWENIRACGYEVSEPLKRGDGRTLTRTVYGLVTQLQQAGLVVHVKATDSAKNHDAYTGEKRIPDIYMRSSRKQRLELLRGLMDTDGTHNRKRNQSVFSTTEKALAYQVEELAASLGWKAYTCPHKYAGFGVTGIGYQVTFIPVGENPFRLSRKADLVQPKKVAGSTYRIVQAVVPIPSVATRCIDVDSPDHLYLITSQFIPTHNCQSDGVRAKLKSNGPPRHYFIQMLLYAQGYRNLGLPVERVALISWPRTRSTLDELFVWDHVLTPEDEDLVAEVLERTRVRQLLADEVSANRMSLMQIPPTPSDSECYYCPVYRPQAATDGGSGCPGTLMKRDAA